MIHGILCNRGVWRHWFEPLRAAGFAPVRAIDLEPVFADIEHCAAAVAAELRALQRQCGGERVSIIAHSMGGLVARAALRVVGPGVIRRIVTIASPHHGTLWARLLPCPPMRQMRADSSWLATLNASQESHCVVPLTCIFSEQDEFILPPGSAAMAQASLHALRGAGHFGVLASRRCLDLSLSALKGG
jgi:pimeloyl-ACP methyl ester carboxylesterase